ncbi:DUF3343 domain-containing protein [Clostridium sp. OS1-26]|uniref:DUF3343 domain-containing protein n=1 Tax=Clostridium sp. OS1-26 TaxID=3070681 RepID=UPI0027DF073D|nr:DUF3343 domain-containing protein [Clostridium sp. OS1-26]WML35826.1 DUF3343 domain-containing protein [Clostridium sp. OS1-26]
MYNEQSQYLLVFASHNQAVFLFNKLLRKGYKVELVSTPCTLSAGCTQSIKFMEKDMQAIKTEIKAGAMRVKGIYKIAKNGPRYTYIKVI